MENRKTKYRRLHRELGLCKDCSEPVGRTRLCKKHRELYRLRDLARDKERRKILADEGKCTRCHVPLDAEMDEGYVTCLTCRQYRRRDFATFRV